ncbi:MAG: hypothetical protein ABIJ34_07210 [archaeon]
MGAQKVDEKDLADAISAHFNPTPKKEFLPEIHLDWYLPTLVYEKIQTWRAIMQDHPDITGCELAMMPLFGRETNVVQDAVMFGQQVSPGRVIRTQPATDEVYQKIKSTNSTRKQQLNLGGIFHYHPQGFLVPSSGLDGDLTDFEKITRWNMNYQTHYGWRDVTDEFAMAGSEEHLQAALRKKDAAIVGSKREIVFKVEVGYSLFLIFNEGASPWIGVGVCQKESFNGRNTYHLLTPEDGLVLHVEDIPCRAKIDYQKMQKEIEIYVKPIEYALPARPSVQTLVNALAVYYPQPSSGFNTPNLLPDLNQNMPLTATELLNLIGDYLRFAEDSADARSIRFVYDLLATQIQPGGNYDAQLSAVQTALASLSPSYSQVLKLKNGK